jgi:hypothetical protein
MLAVQSVRLLMDPNAEDASTKFRTTLLQQVRANNGKDFAYDFEQVRNKPIGKE